MTKFSDRIKKSAKISPIILANDYNPKIPNIESKTLRNIKLLNNYLCGIKINFHLLLQLDKKQISNINRTAHDCGLQCIADIKLNDIENTNFITAENLWNMGFDAVIVNPIMGKKSLKNLVELSHKKNKGVISLCHMSAPEAKFSYELEIKNNSNVLHIGVGCSHGVQVLKNKFNSFIDLTIAGLEKSKADYLNIKNNSTYLVDKSNSEQLNKILK